MKIFNRAKRNQSNNHSNFSTKVVKRFSFSVFLMLLAGVLFYSCQDETLDNNTSSEELTVQNPVIEATDIQIPVDIEEWMAQVEQEAENTIKPRYSDISEIPEKYLTQFNLNSESRLSDCDDYHTTEDQGDEIKCHFSTQHFNGGIVLVSNLWGGSNVELSYDYCQRYSTQGTTNTSFSINDIHFDPVSGGFAPAAVQAVLTGTPNDIPSTFSGATFWKDNFNLIRSYFYAKIVSKIERDLWENSFFIPYSPTTPGFNFFVTVTILDYTCYAKCNSGLGIEYVPCGTECCQRITFASNSNAPNPIPYVEFILGDGTNNCPEESANTCPGSSSSTCNQLGRDCDGSQGPNYFAFNYLW